MKESLFLKTYLKQRPLFLSLIRAKEAELYQKHVPLKSPTLDIGCGDGFFAQTAFGQLDLGIDLKDSRINQTITKNVYGKTMIFDGVRIPLKTASVGTAVSNCVLEHVENLDGLLQEVHRVLKPGAKFITTVMAKPWEDNLFGALFLGNTYRQWMRNRQIHVNLLDEAGWVEKFKSSRFKIIEETGYVSPAACKLLDVCHYLSIPNLITYVLTGKWVIGPQNDIYPIKKMEEKMNENVDPKDSGAIFYVLQKN